MPTEDKTGAGAPMTLISHIRRGRFFDPRGKRFTLNEDGTVESDSSAYRAGGRGLFEVVRVHTAQDLIAALDELKPGVVVVWSPVKIPYSIDYMY